MKRMTNEQARQIIVEHNESIDKFINEDLAKRLGAKNGRVSLNQWFKAQGILKEQNFYEKAMEILNMLNGYGYEVKINMQSNKLVSSKLCIY